MDVSAAWWDRGRFAGRLVNLEARARIVAAIRRFFAERDFLEVDTPALQVSPGLEPHLMAFSTELVTPERARRPLHLHTSPEFAMKKLLVAGLPRIFQLAHVFRNGERSRTHHPEFTMLEWYRANEGYEALMDDCAALLAEAAKASEAKEFSFRGRTIDPFAPPERITVADAFARHAGVDLLATICGGEGDRALLAAEAVKAGVAIAGDDTWGDIFSRILAEKIEPHLGNGRATILYEYPLPQAALARPKPGSDRVAERFELFACGVELANAFGELTDAAEQRKRFTAAMDEKARIHGERYPVDEDFLDALGQMPQASGIALGFDRLAMLASGAQRIDQVIWAPVVET
jgi:elongation factor P--(R)-beta-lysine ligase